MGRLQGNSEEAIEKATQKATATLKSPKGAINALTTLTAVGPATASAVLAAAAPEKFAFMADEAIDSVGVGPRNYSLSQYLAFNAKVTEKVQLPAPRITVVSRRAAVTSVLTLLDDIARQRSLAAHGLLNLLGVPYGLVQSARHFIWKTSPRPMARRQSD